MRMKQSSSSRKRIPLIPPLPRSKPPLPPLILNDRTTTVFPAVNLLRTDRDDDDGKDELPMYEVYRLTGAITPYSYYFARRPSLQPDSASTAPTVRAQGDDDISPLEESESRRVARLRRRRTIGDATAIGGTSYASPSATTTTTVVAGRPHQQKEPRTRRPRPVTYIEETENMKQVKANVKAQPDKKAERNRSQSQTRPLTVLVQKPAAGSTSVHTPVRTNMHMSTTSVLLLPNLNTDSLWLNRPTRARAKTNTGNDLVQMKEKTKMEVDGVRQSSASSTATLVPTPPPQHEVQVPVQVPNTLVVPPRPARPPESLYSNESTFRSICASASMQDKDMGMRRPTSSLHMHQPQSQPHHYPQHLHPHSGHQQLNQEKRRSKQRTASVATSMSFYSQKSYPHRLQLPAHVDSEELKWLVIDDDGGDDRAGSDRKHLAYPSSSSSSLSQSQRQDAGRRPSISNLNLSDGKSTVTLRSRHRSTRTRTQTRPRSRSRSRSRHRARRAGGGSGSGSSSSNNRQKEQEPSTPSIAPSAWSATRFGSGSGSRAPSVAPSAWSAPMSTSMSASASRSVRTVGSRSVAPSAWSGGRSVAPSIAPSTFTATSRSTSTSTSTTTSGWARRDISEVQEDMKSFLDMSEDSRWCFSSSSSSSSSSASSSSSSSFASASESGLGPGPDPEPQTQTPAGLSLVPSFASGNTNANGALTGETRRGWKDRDSTILPRSRSHSPRPSLSLGLSPNLGLAEEIRYSPSLNPTLAYIVFGPEDVDVDVDGVSKPEEEEEEEESSPPSSLNSPQMLLPSSSTASSSSSSTAVESNSEGRLDSGQGALIASSDGDEICEDYDYRFAVDILVDHQHHQQPHCRHGLENVIARDEAATDEICGEEKGKGKDVVVVQEKVAMEPEEGVRRAEKEREKKKEKENVKPPKARASASPSVQYPESSRRSQSQSHSRARASSRREESVGLRSGHHHHHHHHAGPSVAYTGHGHGHGHAKGPTHTRMQARSVRAVRKKTSARTLRKDFGSRNVGVGVGGGGGGGGVDVDVDVAKTRVARTPGGAVASGVVGVGVGVLDSRLQPEYYNSTGAGSRMNVDASASAKSKARASLQKKRGLDDVRGVGVYVRPVAVDNNNAGKAKAMEMEKEKGREKKSTEKKKSLFGSFLHVASLFARV